MWAYIGALAYGDVVLRTRKAKHCTARAQPAILLPADAESVAALHGKVNDILTDILCLEGIDPEEYQSLSGHADAILALIGLTPASGRKGKR